jgi:vancomycin permeability regulator SanA
LQVTATLDRNKTKAQTPTGKKKRGGKLKMWLLIIILLLVVAGLTPFLIVHSINDNYEKKVYTSTTAVPNAPVAIVFGAGLNRDGAPSWMLADRLKAAIELYQAGKVQKLLLTGDNVSSIEVDSMKNYVVRRGVPAEVVIRDDAGMRTYDSCYRAVHNFGITNAILVTQGYHLPRALYLCDSLGVRSVGFKAGIDDYPGQGFYNSREFWATFNSWLDINIIHPKLQSEGSSEYR